MSTTRRILVVDDDREIREILADILQDEGYAVVQAKNGAAALDALRDEPHPCVILLDLMMPIMDGTEFRQNQLADPKLANIPVVLFTADHTAAQKRELAGVAEVMFKPVGIADLMAVLMRICCSQTA
jgi:CheY-like chemotaxis protein